MSVLPAPWAPLLRLVFLLGSFGATVAIVLWRGAARPGSAPGGDPALEAAVVAGGMQLWLGVILDGICVALGLWRYPAAGPTVLSVPLDLHLAWALLYGVGFTLAAPLHGAARWRFALLVWAVTWTFDGLCLPAMPAICVVAPGLTWLLADGLLLAVLLGTTLWLHGDILRARAGVDPPSPGPRTALYMAAFGSSTLLYLPALLLALVEIPTWPPRAGAPGLVTAGGLAVLAVSLGGWAVQSFAEAGGTPLPFDPPRRLVITGPYAYLRNPMQVSGVLCALALWAAYGSWLLAVYAVDLILISELIFARHEEPQLLARFGDPYIRYRTAVHRWWPRARGYRDEITGSVRR